MSQKAIIHTATKVIRRLTTDDNPELQTDESAIEFQNPIGFVAQYTKLDANNQPVAATIDEADAAGMVPEREATRRTAKQVRLIKALGDAAASTNLPPLVKEVCAALKAFYEP